MQVQKDGVHPRHQRPQGSFRLDLGHRQALARLHRTSGCPQHLSEASHTFTSGEYSNNSSFHWQICTICGGTSAKAAHTDANGDGVCDVCHRGGMR